MGLKKYNYEAKKFNQTLPEAYALIKNIVITGREGYADIIIQSSRENAKAVLDNLLQPYDTVRVNFKVERDANAYVTAYETAKASTEVKRFNPVLGKLEYVKIDGPFAGWDNDINY